ncbi:hypothetical protein LCGC14_2037080 [marine sediment metagenome]|uniref:Uncharacterized protein n=1 Tax=marine sediment metagenome TaxID=412755 RepID=A0A0F9ET63_9ZZZZ
MTKKLRELITELRTESQEVGIDPQKYKSPWELLASIADRIEAALSIMTKTNWLFFTGAVVTYTLAMMAFGVLIWEAIND